MDTVLIIIGALLAISAICYLVSKFVGTPNQNTSSSTVQMPAAHTPPPLPQPRQSIRQCFRPVQTSSAQAPAGQTIYDFPKCYICRQRNYPGEQQLVFWDGTRNCYRCSRGHNFTGKE